VNGKSADEGLPTWVLLAGCALALLIQFKSWEQICRLFLIPGPGIYRGFYTRELYRLLMAMLLIVPPAVLLGMIYPRLLRTPIAKRDGGAWLAGYLSAANSVGCLLGALAATFVFVPLLGSEVSLKVIIVVLAAMSIAFVAREAGQPRSARAVAGCMIAILGLAVVPIHWDWASLTTGVPMYFGEVMKSEGPSTASLAAPAGPVATSSLIFRDENIQGGFTTVVDTVGPGTRMRAMYTNGKLQGNDDVHGEFGLNFGIVFIPAMFSGRFDRALLIGLGSGQSAWLLQQAGFQTVDIAEFSPGIVRAAAEKFTHINHGILSDPKVRVILEDGRNMLLVESGRKYNLITVELTTIWFSGATNLYSREFYELARRRLEDDGILQQWVQLHRIGPDAISSALATARSVFPYVAYWSYGGQGMIIAGNRPLVMNDARNALLANRLQHCPDLSQERASQIAQEMVRAELLGSEGVDGLIASRHPVVNTDHNRFIEYDTPRYSSSERDWRGYNIAFFRGWEAKAGGKGLER
jgi:spermidine synthase